ncbi:MAG: CHAT domain-containing protein [Planctomycetota bacterium]|nr:CHAT domain-containing protein [Planctomycetota bacterium]
MLRVRALCVLLILLGLALGPSTAEEPKDERLSPAQAAARVLRAFDAKDDAALATLAARVSPDPWLTTRELLHGGRFPAAERFARDVPATRRGKLRDEIAAWQEEPESAEAWDALAEATSQFSGMKLETALSTLERATPKRTTSRLIHRFLTTRLQEALEKAPGLRAAYEQIALDAADLGWTAVSAECNLRAARAAYVERDWAEAARLFEAAWAAAQIGTPLRTHPVYLWELAMGLRRAGRTDDTRAAAEALVEVGRRLGSPRQESKGLNMVGLSATKLGLLEDAEAAHRASLAIHQKTANRKSEAIERINLARVLILQRRLSEARRVLDAALPLVVDPALRLERAHVLRTLGNVHYARGEHGRALARYEESLALAEELKHKRAIALALHGLGGALRHVGDLERAVEVLERSFRLKLERKNSRGASRTLSRLGYVHQTRRDFDAARTAYDLSLQYKEALRDRPGIAETLLSRGHLNRQTNRFDEAETDLRRALLIFKELGMGAGQSAALGGLADVAHAQGDLKTARTMYEKAVDMLDVTESPRDALGTYGGLVRVLGKLGDHEATIAVARKGFELIARIQVGLDDEQLIEYRARYADMAHTGMLAAKALNRAADAFHLLEAGRAGALLAMLGGRELLEADAFEGDAHVAEQEARAAERRARQELALAIARNDAKAVAAARGRLAAAQGALSDAVRALRSADEDAAEVFYPRPLALADYQKTLEKGDAFVAFETDGRSLLAVVVSEASARVVSLGALEPIREALASLRLDAPPLLNQKALEHIRTLLVTPLALPPSARRLLVSPTGPLSGFPFAVVLPDREIAYVPSATTHALLMKGCVRCGKGVLAVGDPAYPPGATANGVVLERLPHTIKEVKLIGDQVLLGKDATPSGFRLALKQRSAWSAVHLACHAVMNPSQPSRSALALTPGSEDDGRLTVRDVFRLRVPADLVVLSACESGIGSYRSGEGLTGFTRAFMYAGSPRVVVSLWMVDDEATSALMKKFYELWRTTEDGTPSGNPTTTAKALREAQAWMRSQDRWKHPYYWAAWSLWGAPE